MQHSGELRAKVLAAIVAGTSVLAASREFNVSPSTIRMWRSAANITPVVSTEKKQDLGVLVVRYLTAGLETLEAQARLFADADWVKKQSAGDLAILHGVLADKLVRILAAVEPDGDSS